MKVVNLTRNQIIVENLKIADTVLARIRGLLGKDSFPAGSGLLIRPCKGIHTIGMKFPIDVIFLDRDNNVLAVRKELKPNVLTRIFFKAVNVLELPAKTIDSTGTSIGDKIGII